MAAAEEMAAAQETYDNADRQLARRTQNANADRQLARRRQNANADRQLATVDGDSDRQDNIHIEFPSGTNLGVGLDTFMNACREHPDGVRALVAVFNPLDWGPEQIEQLEQGQVPEQRQGRATNPNQGQGSGQEPAAALNDASLVDLSARMVDVSKAKFAQFLERGEDGGPTATHYLIATMLVTSMAHAFALFLVNQTSRFWADGIESLTGVSLPGEVFGSLNKVESAIHKYCVRLEEESTLRARNADPESLWYHLSEAFGMTYEKFDSDGHLPRGFVQFRTFMHSPKADMLFGAQALGTEPPSNLLSVARWSAMQDVSKRCMLSQAKVSEFRQESAKLVIAFVTAGLIGTEGHAMYAKGSGIVGRIARLVQMSADTFESIRARVLLKPSLIFLGTLAVAATVANKMPFIELDTEPVEVGTNANFSGGRPARFHLNGRFNNFHPIDPQARQKRRAPNGKPLSLGGRELHRGACRMLMPSL